MTCICFKNWNAISYFKMIYLFKWISFHLLQCGQCMFLAVQNSSIYRRPCLSLGPLLAWAPLTIREFTTLQRDPRVSSRDLWPLRHLIRVTRRHDLTKKYRPAYIPILLLTYLCTYIREQPEGAILGTCDIWDTDYNTEIHYNLTINCDMSTLDSIRN